VKSPVVSAPINWEFHSDSDGRFVLFNSMFLAQTRSSWFCVSRAKSANESPVFEEAECILDMKSLSGSWVMYSENAKATAVVPVQNNANDLALFLYRDGALTDLKTSCVTLPLEIPGAGTGDSLVVSLDSSCRINCQEGTYILRGSGDGQGECFRPVGGFLKGVSASAPHFFELTSKPGSMQVDARTLRLTPGAQAQTLDSLSLGAEESLTKVGRYGGEPRFYAYTDANDTRIFRDDLLVDADGGMSRVPSRLASLTDTSRILSTTTSPDGTSTFLLLQTKESTLDVVRVDAIENRVAWRRTLKGGFIRLNERIAANQNGVGYWAARETSERGKAEIWFEFLEN